MESEPAPPKSHLAHIIGAIAVVLMGAVRVLDDCGRAGLAMGRSADDVARFGHSADDVARFGNSADDVARFGNVGDGLPGGARFAHGADPLSAGPWGLADDVPHASTTEANDILETVAEGSVDIALEVLDVPLDDAEYDEAADDGSASGDPSIGERSVAVAVTCPARIDITADPERWRSFAETGFGAACAPNLVFGRAAPDDPERLVWGDGQRDIRQLATDCWNAGSTCVFVACDDGCAGQIAALPYSTRDMDGGLAHYTAVLTRAVVGMDPKPRVVAVVRGDRAPQMQMVVR